MDSCYSGGVSERKARDVKIAEDPYEKMAEGEGRLVIAASQPDQRSFEDEKLSHGIFTHHLFQNNFITANKMYAIPGDEYPFEYELSGPRGVEKIKAIATTSKLNLLDFEFSKAEFFHSVESGIAARDISIVAKKMEEVPVDSWAEATCEFEVG